MCHHIMMSVSDNWGKQQQLSTWQLGAVVATVEHVIKMQ